MTTPTTEAPLSWGTLTNTCTCEVWNDDTNDWEQPETCFGDCWDDSLHAFGFAVAHLLDISQDFVVYGIRLWDGEVSGRFTARSVADFVRGCSVDSAWHMEYQVFHNRMEYSLSHHDAPTGSASIVVPIASDDEWGD